LGRFPRNFLRVDGARCAESQFVRTGRSPSLSLVISLGRGFRIQLHLDLALNGDGNSREHRVNKLLLEQEIHRDARESPVW
jgi:hypothetical protein